LCTEILNNPPVCPECGSANVALVLWGLPDFENEELIRMVREGRVNLGGCCVPTGGGRYWKCNKCDHRFCNSDEEEDYGE